MGAQDQRTAGAMAPPSVGVANADENGAEHQEDQEQRRAPSTKWSAAPWATEAQTGEAGNQPIHDRDGKREHNPKNMVSTTKSAPCDSECRIISSRTRR